MARRGKDKMKYKGFYCSEELWNEMVKCAIASDEDNSEYIRKAVEMRNVQHQSGGMGYVENGNITVKPLPSEGVKPGSIITSKPTIPELKEKVKEMESNFRPCPKGGK